MKPVFNKKEKIGFAALLLLSVLALLVSEFCSDYFRKPHLEDEEKVVRIADSLRLIGIVETRAEEPKKEKKKQERFIFDPNTIQEKDWVRLGLSQKQAQSILKYTAKGGRFRKKEDLKKMYVISEEKYKDLEPYIDIHLPEKEIDKKYVAKKVNEEKIPADVPKTIISINTADSLALMRIRGIGAVYASRIIKYRNRLGGFVSKKQFSEIWGLAPESLENLRTSVKIDLEHVKKIRVNYLRAKTLPPHPYLRYKDAYKILNYIEQNGKLKDCTDLQKIVSLSDKEALRKLCPYLDFN